MTSLAGRGADTQKLFLERAGLAKLLQMLLSAVTVGLGLVLADQIPARVREPGWAKVPVSSPSPAGGTHRVPDVVARVRRASAGQGSPGQLCCPSTSVAERSGQPSRDAWGRVCPQDTGTLGRAEQAPILCAHVPGWPDNNSNTQVCPRDKQGHNPISCHEYLALTRCGRGCPFITWSLHSWHTGIGTSIVIDAAVAAFPPGHPHDTGRSPCPRGLASSGTYCSRWDPGSFEVTLQIPGTARIRTQLMPRVSRCKAPCRPPPLPAGFLAGGADKPTALAQGH